MIDTRWRYRSKRSTRLGRHVWEVQRRRWFLPFYSVIGYAASADLARDLAHDHATLVSEKIDLGRFPVLEGDR